MRTLDLGSDKSGNKIALVKLNNGSFLVYIQKCNYSNGRDVLKWFPCMTSIKQDHNDFQTMVKHGLDESTARALFTKRTKQ